MNQGPSELLQRALIAHPGRLTAKLTAAAGGYGMWSVPDQGRPLGLACRDVVLVLGCRCRWCGVDGACARVRRVGCRVT